MLIKNNTESDAKRMIEIEKPYFQPFNYEYYCPITGDTIGCFTDNSIVPSQKQSQKRTKKYALTKIKGKDKNNIYIKKHEDLHLDLFTIRATQEIKKRLGENCLDDENDPTYPDALFMAIWNKINNEADEDLKATSNKIGAKIHQMLHSWMVYFPKINPKVR